MGASHRVAVATTWRTCKRKEFVPRGMRKAQGKLFALEGCGAKPKASPSPRQDSRQDKDAQAACSEWIQGWLAPVVTASPVPALTLASSTPSTTAKNQRLPAWRLI